MSSLDTVLNIEAASVLATELTLFQYSPSAARRCALDAISAAAEQRLVSNPGVSGNLDDIPDEFYSRLLRLSNDEVAQDVLDSCSWGSLLDELLGCDFEQNWIQQHREEIQ